MAVGSGPSRGMSGGGYSNYNYKTVPGQNSVGNWNTGGSNYGYGNQNGITRYGQPEGLAGLPRAESPKQPKPMQPIQPIPPKVLNPIQSPVINPVGSMTPIQQLMAGAGQPVPAAHSYPHTFGPRAPGSWPSYPQNTKSGSVWNGANFNNASYGSRGPGLNPNGSWGGGR